MRRDTHEPLIRSLPRHCSTPRRIRSSSSTSPPATVIAANVQARTDTGYRSDELQGAPIGRLLRQADGNGARNRRAQSLLARDLAYGLVQLRTRTGEGFPASVSTSLFHWEERPACWSSPRRGRARKRRERAADVRVARAKSFRRSSGQSVKIREVCRRIGSLAKSDVTVLIQGESGTGKEVIANAVHAHSQRGRGPFVKVNCAGAHRDAPRERAVRPREGRIHRRDPRSAGTLQAGRRRHDLPRRDRRACRSRCRRSCCACCRSASSSPWAAPSPIKSNVRVIAATNSDLAKAVSGGQVPRGPVLSPQRRSRSRAAAARAQGRHRAARESFPAAATPEHVDKTIRALAPRRSTLLVRHTLARQRARARERGRARGHRRARRRSICAGQPAHEPCRHRALYPAMRQREVRARLARQAQRSWKGRSSIEALARANGIKKRAAAMLGVDARNLPYLLKKHHLDSASQPDGSVH